MIVPHTLLASAAIIGMVALAGAQANSDEIAIEIPPPVRVIAVSRDGKVAVTGDDASTIRVWDLAERSLKRTVNVLGPHQHTFPCYAISADGRHSLVGHSDGFLRYGNDLPVHAPTLTLWDLNSGKMIRAFMNKGARVGRVALSPDGKLAFASDGIEVKVIKNGDGGFPVGVATLRLWDVSTGKSIHTLLDRNLDCGGGMAFSPDGKLCAVGGGIGQRVQGTMPGWDVKIWDTTSGKEFGSIPAAKGSDGVSCLAFSPDSSHIVAAVGQRMIHLWDRVSGKLIWSWGDSTCIWTAHSVTFAPDGKTVLACGPITDFLRRVPNPAGAGRLVMIDAATGKEKSGFTGTEQWITACAFTPDGKHVLAAAALATQCVDATNGALKFLLKK